MTSSDRKSIPFFGFLPCLLAGSEWGTLALLAGLSLFYGLLTTLPLLASLFSITISRSGALLLIVLAVLAGGWYWKSLRGNEGKGSLNPPGSFATGFFYITLVLYLLLWVLAYALPDFSYDGNYYHAPTIHFWLRHGGVHWIEDRSFPSLGAGRLLCLERLSQGNRSGAVCFPSGHRLQPAS